MKKLLISLVIFFALFLTLSPPKASVEFSASLKPSINMTDKAMNTASKLSTPPSYAPGELIIKFKEGKVGMGALSPGSSISVLNSKYSASFEKLLKKTYSKDLDRLYILKLPQNSDVQKIMAEYKRDPNVEYAEPNYVVHALDTSPNDLNFSLQWALKNTGQNGGTAGADIHATQAWDITNGSSDVVVAVIDTGVDYNHPDLAANMWTNPVDGSHGWNFVSNNNNPMDDFGHGTHCAGIIGAIGNNSLGVAGVNWHVKIAALKFLDSSGSGYTSDAVNAINYANLMGFKILSNSWGGGGYSKALLDAIEGYNALGANNTLFIVAAGNSYLNNNDVNPTYPCSYNAPNIICVAATDSNDSLSWFSNYGPTTVDIGAPGGAYAGSAFGPQDIYSTVPNGTCTLCNPSGYAYLAGTSMATPFVSGAAALIKAGFPSLTATQIKARILSSADPVSSLQGKVLSNGRLNVYSALLNDTTPPAAISDLGVVNITLTNATLNWTAVGDNGTIGTASFYDVRYSASPINDSTFEFAAQFPGAPVPNSSGSPETFTIGGTYIGVLLPNTTYYFAIKVYDSVGNPSTISNVVNATTPLLPAIPGCDLLITSPKYVINSNNTTYCLFSDMSASMDGIDFSSYIQNSTLDCRGFNIYGSGNYAGVYLYYNTNDSIKNCKITNFTEGIELIFSNGNNITNITANSNTFGVLLDLSSNNTISDITAVNNIDDGTTLFSSAYNKFMNIYLSSFRDSSNDGIFYISGSSSNQIINATIVNAYASGFYIYSSTNNTIKDSTITNCGSYGIRLYYSGSPQNMIYNNLLINNNNIYFSGTSYSNYWNTTRQPGARIYSGGLWIGGNYWSNPSGNGYSDTCTDANKDGLCDSPYDVLNNKRCTAGLDCSSNTDYLPYSSAGSNLAGYWKFDEGSGSSSSDSSGNGNTGTIRGGTWATGKYGNALSFNGASSYVDVPYSTSLNSPVDAVTACAWVYSNQLYTAGFRTLLGKSRSGAPGAGYSFGIYNEWSASGGYPCAEMYVGTTYEAVCAGSTNDYLNKWAHLCETYDKATGSLNLYENGVQIGSIVAGAGTINLSTSDLFIGGGTGGTFNGTIDEVRIYNRALSSTEIANLSLMGYWKFDEGLGTNAYDSSGNGNTGTLVNSPTWTTGKYGNALSYNGISNKEVDISLSPSNPLNFSGVNTITMSAWVNFAGTSSNGEEDLMGNAVGSNGYILSLKSGLNSQIRCLLYDGSSPHYLDTARSSWTAGTWYHVACTYDGTKIRTYVNGVLDNTGSSDVFTIHSSTGNLIIGSAYGHMNGTIDEVRIYNRALSSTEIENLYNYSLIGYWKFDEGLGTNAYDSSGNGNTGTLVNSPTWTTGKYGNALSYNGISNKEVDMPLSPSNQLNITGGNTITMSAWVNFVGTSPNGEEDLMGNAVGANGYILNLKSGLNSQIRCLFYDGANPHYLDTTQASWTAGTWYHVACTYDGTKIRTYINGALDNTGGSDVFTIHSSTGNLIIGSAYGHMNGTIDEVRIYNRALSSTEISNLYP